MDDRSRIAYVEAHRDERKETAAAFMTRAIDWFAEHGITIERAMTDNGACYRSGAFRDTLQSRQIRHPRTRPYRPQTNGKVERFNLTLKNEWAYTRAFTSNQARLDTLETFVHDYNHHRGHTAHDESAPMSLVNNGPAHHN